MPLVATHCPGFRMKFTRDLTRGEYVQLCRGLGVVPDTCGFILLNTYGRYKVMRHYLLNPLNPAQTIYWPKFNPETVLEEWKDNTDILVFKGTHGHTYLKAFDGAPGWTIDELTFYRTIMENYGILTDSMPKPKDLIWRRW